MCSQVDEFIDTSNQWREEMELVRQILLGTSLKEEFKWRKPCYTFDGKNIVIVQGFKDYCALMFFKGVLLKDTKSILQKTGPNTHVGRQIRFTSPEDVRHLESTIPQYIEQAIEVEKSGRKVEVPEEATLNIPVELQDRLQEDDAFRAAFEKLTPGRQRAYIFYFSGAKQSSTRKSRIEKSIPKILEGKGPNER